MRTKNRNWMSSALILAVMALVGGDWSPDGEQALLGRTKAEFHPYEVSSSKSPVSATQALLGQIAGIGVRTSAAESQNRITASFALLGR
jgi:hypothetical protein